MVKTPYFLVELYKFLGEDSGYSRTPDIIYNFMDSSSNNGLEIAKDTVSIKFKNQQKFNEWKYKLTDGVPLNNKFRFNDNIRIYAWYGDDKPSAMENYLLFDGLVRSITQDKSENDVGITLSATNRTEEILRFYKPFVTTATSTINTSPLIIKELLHQVNVDNRRNRFIVGNYLSNEINPITGQYGKIQNVRSDNSNFTNINYSKTYVPVYKHVSILSEPENTGETTTGVYLYYITQTPVVVSQRLQYGSYIDELVWKPKSVTTTLSLTEDQHFFSPKFSHAVGDVINFYIIDAGLDCDGHGITTSEVNTESAGRYGMKTRYYSESRRIASEVINKELNNGQLLNSYHDPTVKDTTHSRYPPGVIAGSVWNFTFFERDGTGNYIGVRKSVSSKKDYNSAVREEAKWQSRMEVREILKRTGQPRYGLQVKLPLGNQYINDTRLGIGDIYTLIIPSLGWTSVDSYKLRLVAIRHQFSQNQWNTLLEFKEDEKVVSERVNFKA